MDFQSWLNDVNGRTIGDGQCVALAEDYITRVCAMPAVATPSGYAGSMYESGPASGFGQLPASETGMPGYLAIWGNGPFTPLTHVAPVVQDDGLTLKCMSQNPGPAHYMDIPKIGLKGYLTAAGGTTAITAASVQTASSSNPIDALTSIGNSFGTVFNWLSQPDNWRRIGVAVLGAILLIIAIAIILKDTGAGKWTTSTLRSIPKLPGTAQH